MKRSTRHCLVGLFVLVLWGAPPAQAQTVPPPGAEYSQDLLDSLLAPIALYPDSLLTQVLVASTYPLEVTAAARFVRQNPGLAGEALDSALADKTWDPSVLMLAQFPQVLVMMDDKLEWTQQLGDAFLADQQRVMDTVQSLRTRAQAAGNLQSTPQQTVVVQDRVIAIEPAQPQVVYVPVYDPTVIYGTWWAPAYRPWYWVPPRVYGYSRPAIVTGIVFGAGLAIAADRFGWARPDWRSRSIAINVNNHYFVNRPRYQAHYAGGRWEHLPEHRKGIAYRDIGTRDRYLRVDSRAVQARSDARGYDLPRPIARPIPSVELHRPAPRAVTPHVVERPAPRLTVQPAPRPVVQSAPRPVVQSAPRPAVQLAPRPAVQSAQTFNGAQNRAQVQANADRGRASVQSMHRTAPERPAPQQGHGGSQPGRGPQQGHR